MNVRGGSTIFFFFFKERLAWVNQSTEYAFVVFIVFQCVNVFLNGFSKVGVWKGFAVCEVRGSILLLG